MIPCMYVMLYPTHQVQVLIFPNDSHYFTLEFSTQQLIEILHLSCNIHSKSVCFGGSGFSTASTARNSRSSHSSNNANPGTLRFLRLAMPVLLEGRLLAGVDANADFSNSEDRV